MSKTEEDIVDGEEVEVEYYYSFEIPGILIELYEEDDIEEAKHVVSVCFDQFPKEKYGIVFNIIKSLQEEFRNKIFFNVLMDHYYEVSKKTKR